MGGENDPTTTSTTSTTATTTTTTAPPAYASAAPIRMHLEAEYPSYPRALAGVTAATVCHLVAGSEAEVLPEKAAAAARVPLDLVAAIDVSGSMAGEKLRLVRETLKFIVRQLRAGDRLGLVAFDTNVRVALPALTMEAGNKDKALKVIDQLRDGSCTNLSGGLFAAIKMMQELQSGASDGGAFAAASAASASAASAPAARVASILLLTDGIANEGITAEAELVAATRALIGARRTFAIYTFGYGSDAQPALLKALSETAGGMYYFVETADRAPEAFADVLGGLLTTVAQNMQLTLQVPPSARAYCQIAKVDTSYTHTLAADGYSLSVQLGDMQAEEVRDVVLHLSLPAVPDHIPAAAADSALPHLAASLEYVNVVSAGFARAEAELCLGRPAGVPAERPASELVREQLQRVLTAQALKEALSQAERGDLSRARGVLDSCMAAPMMQACSPALQLDLQQAMTNLSDMGRYQAKGRHGMSSAMQSHAAQRSNRMMDAEEEAVGATPAYVTKSKGAWRGFAKSNVS